MSDKMRWRYGDTNPVVSAVNEETVIEIGDLVFLDATVARPANVVPNQGSKAATQSLFATKFLGVAMQRSRAGDTSPIRVATTGVFEFDCAPTVFQLGDLVGVEQNTAGTALLSQQVGRVTAAAQAIGRAAKREPGAATTVLVDVRSTVMTGGVLCRT